MYLVNLGALSTVAAFFCPGTLYLARKTRNEVSCDMACFFNPVHGYKGQATKTSGVYPQYVHGGSISIYFQRGLSMLVRFG